VHRLVYFASRLHSIGEAASGQISKARLPESQKNRLRNANRRS
jgi:hypothetical protein